MENFSDRMKKVKAEKHMTTEDLSAASGIPLGTLSKIMAGMSESPKLSNVIALADALGVSVGYLAAGEEENDYNYTLESDEIDLIENYRMLDAHGRKMVDVVISVENERISRQQNSLPDFNAQEMDTKAPLITGKKREILLYDMRVSAGLGNYLDGDSAETLRIPDNEQTRTADYALRISGDSMETAYHNGDILLVQKADEVAFGELGIFLLDGQAYFKQYGGDRLVSLNDKYKPLMLSNFTGSQCLGRVIGRMRRRANA